MRSILRATKGKGSTSDASIVRPSSAADAKMARVTLRTRDWAKDPQARKASLFMVHLFGWPFLVTIVMAALSPFLPAAAALSLNTTDHAALLDSMAAVAAGNPPLAPTSPSIWINPNQVASAPDDEATLAWTEASVATALGLAHMQSQGAHIAQGQVPWSSESAAHLLPQLAQRLAHTSLGWPAAIDQHATQAMAATRRALLINAGAACLARPHMGLLVHHAHAFARSWCGCVRKALPSLTLDDAAAAGHQSNDELWSSVFGSALGNDTCERAMAHRVHNAWTPPDTPLHVCNWDPSINTNTLGWTRAAAACRQGPAESMHAPAPGFCGICPVSAANGSAPGCVHASRPGRCIVYGATNHDMCQREARRIRRRHDAALHAQASQGIAGDPDAGLVTGAHWDPDMRECWLAGVSSADQCFAGWCGSRHQRPMRYSEDGRVGPGHQRRATMCASYCINVNARTAADCGRLGGHEWDREAGACRAPLASCVSASMDLHHFGDWRNKFYKTPAVLWLPGFADTQATCTAANVWKRHGRAQQQHASFNGLCIAGTALLPGAWTPAACNASQPHANTATHNGLVSACTAWMGATSVAQNRVAAAQASGEALASYDQEVASRDWAAQHGGLCWLPAPACSNMTTDEQREGAADAFCAAVSARTVSGATTQPPACALRADLPDGTCHLSVVSAKRIDEHVLHQACTSMHSPMPQQHAWTYRPPCADVASAKHGPDDPVSVQCALVTQPWCTNKTACHELQQEVAQGIAQGHRAGLWWLPAGTHQNGTCAANATLVQAADAIDDAAEGAEAVYWMPLGGAAGGSGEGGPVWRVHPGSEQAGVEGSVPLAELASGVATAAGSDESDLHAPVWVQSEADIKRAGSDRVWLGWVTDRQLVPAVSAKHDPRARRRIALAVWHAWSQVVAHVGDHTHNTSPLVAMTPPAVDGIDWPGMVAVNHADEATRHITDKAWLRALSALNGTDAAHAAVAAALPSGALLVAPDHQRQAVAPWWPVTGSDAWPAARAYEWWSQTLSEAAIDLGWSADVPDAIAAPLTIESPRHNGATALAFAAGPVVRVALATTTTTTTTTTSPTVEGTDPVLCVPLEASLPRSWFDGTPRLQTGTEWHLGSMARAWGMQAATMAVATCPHQSTLACDASTAMLWPTARAIVGGEEVACVAAPLSTIMRVSSLDGSLDVVAWPLVIAQHPEQAAQRHAATQATGAVVAVANPCDTMLCEGALSTCSVQQGRAVCHCERGRTGERCQVRMCMGPHEHGPVRGFDWGFGCQCLPFYEGAACERCAMTSPYTGRAYVCVATATPGRDRAQYVRMAVPPNSLHQWLSGKRTLPSASALHHAHAHPPALPGERGFDCNCVHADAFARGHAASESGVVPVTHGDHEARFVHASVERSLTEGLNETTLAAFRTALDALGLEERTTDALYDAVVDGCDDVSCSSGGAALLASIFTAVIAALLLVLLCFTPVTRQLGLSDRRHESFVDDGHSAYPGAAVPSSTAAAARARRVSRLRRRKASASPSSRSRH